MLAGEYVVVERGVPALSVALPRRLEVEASPLPAGSLRAVSSAGPQAGWTVTSPGLHLIEEPATKVPVLSELLQRIPGVPLTGHFTIKSELGAGDNKPGLGGSAALCAAAAKTLWQLSGASGDVDLELVIQAHRAAQGGRGSGYDVATAMLGGVIVFHPAPRGRAPAGSRVERITWPSGLHAAAFSTGRSASTTELLARVETWREEDEESFEACIGPLAAETLAFVDAFRSQDVRAILDAAAQVQEELATMDRIGDLGVLGGGQLQLLGAIEDHGAIGRTSGAGGGDCAWALSDDPERLEAVSNALEALGFSRQTPRGIPLGAAGSSFGEPG
jgi:phosphomevalonate kinase